MTDEPTKRCVLVVEDDDDVRGAMAALLELKGYRVVEAENGRAALDYLRDALPCLILLDLFMPEMDGWAFRAHQLQDVRLARVPVIILSADGLAAQQAGTTAGVVAVMTKPVEFSRLLAVVGQHC